MCYILLAFGMVMMVIGMWWLWLVVIAHALMHELFCAQNSGDPERIKQAWDNLTKHMEII